MICASHRALLGTVLLAGACSAPGGPGEPWSPDDPEAPAADTDAFDVADDEPGDTTHGGSQTSPDSAPRSCDPQAWLSGWRPMLDAPVLESHVEWEQAGLRPSQLITHEGETRAWYVGQSLEHCSVGGWAATCIVGRVGRAALDAGSWTHADDIPHMDLWNWGLSVRRLFVAPPDRSRSGEWDAWLALEGVDVDSRIYWASSGDGDHWTARLSEPALGPAYGDAWDAGGVTDPAVWSKGGTQFMLYTGFTGDWDRPQIGLAQRTDQGWIRASDDPILPHGEAGRFDAWGVLRPSVLDYDDCIVMFHNTIDENGAATLGVATSVDGFSWARADQPLQLGDDSGPWYDSGAYDPVAYIDDETAYLLYRGANEGDAGGVGWARLD